MEICSFEMKKSKHVPKFRIRIDNIEGKSRWTFGIGMNHWHPETYIYISIFKITIAIGFVDG